MPTSGAGGSGDALLDAPEAEEHDEDDEGLGGHVPKRPRRQSGQGQEPAELNTECDPKRATWLWD